jgi:hypothetical protein
VPANSDQRAVEGGGSERHRKSKHSLFSFFTPGRVANAFAVDPGGVGVENAEGRSDLGACVVAMLVPQPLQLHHHPWP